jgi:Leucine-rich repeat (LRR) protein
LEINLTYNEITVLPHNVFSNLNQLTELYLSYNQINDLQPGVFNGLNSLRTLYLNFNRIVILRRNVFNLVTLTDLRLSFNPATNPINLEHGTLDILSNLRTIYPDGLIPYLPSTSQQRCRLDSHNDHLLSAQAIASAHANPDLANDPKLNQLLSLVQGVPPASPIFDDDDDDNVWVNDDSDDSPPSRGGNLQRNSRKIKRKNYRKSQRKNYYA